LARFTDQIRRAKFTGLVYEAGAAADQQDDSAQAVVDQAHVDQAQVDQVHDIRPVMQSPRPFIPPFFDTLPQWTI
jgi:hypothetical protein